MLARSIHQHAAVTEINRPTGKEKHAMHSGSMDKWFDAACRPIGPARMGRSERPIRYVARLNRNTGYAFGRAPCGLEPLRAMPARAVVNRTG